MYSVVMMMALSGGAEAPDFGRGCHGCSSSCHGCSGSYGCSGCSSSHGCHSSCHSRGGLFRRGGHGCHGCHGCSSGCMGGCYGGGYTCMGGCYGGGYGGCTGGMGGCYGGGYGCMGGGCYGGMGGCADGCYGTPVMGVPVVPQKKGEKVPPPASGMSEAPATILVTLPAEAKLLVDGTATTSTSSQRRLVSPALQPGRDYHYTLTAEISREGQAPIRLTQRVTVRAGEETRVPFTFTDPAVTASR